MVQENRFRACSRIHVQGSDSSPKIFYFLKNTPVADITLSDVTVLGRPTGHPMHCIFLFSVFMGKVRPGITLSRCSPV
jgi:hypothetical protein